MFGARGTAAGGQCAHCLLSIWRPDGAVESTSGPSQGVNTARGGTLAVELFGFGAVKDGPKALK